MPEVPKTGITVLAHVENMLRESQARLDEAASIILAGTRPKPAERDRLQRRLAGVVGNCESIRMWLIKGAPR